MLGEETPHLKVLKHSSRPIASPSTVATTLDERADTALRPSAVANAMVKSLVTKAAVAEVVER